jgi:hypothetical protein
MGQLCRLDSFLTFAILLDSTSWSTNAIGALFGQRLFFEKLQSGGTLPKYEDISILSLTMAAMSAIEKAWTSCCP